MQKVVRDQTILLIKRYISEIGVELPLKDEEDVDRMSEFFGELEVSLANALGCGDKVDQDLLDAAADAYDDLGIFEDDDFHDIEELNRRLLG